MNVNLRPATPADIAEIADIYRYYVEETAVSFETVAPDCDEMIRRLEIFSRGGFPYLVVEQEGHVVGYAYAHPWKERAAYSHTWETTVYLSKQCLGKGVGKLLMEKLIEECSLRGCHALIACITAENSTSRTFHERLGFSQVSLFKEVGYKMGRYLDVVDYEMRLTSSR